MAFIRGWGPQSSQDPYFLGKLCCFTGENWNHHYTTWIWPNSRLVISEKLIKLSKRIEKNVC